MSPIRLSLMANFGAKDILVISLMRDSPYFSRQAAVLLLTS